MTISLPVPHPAGRSRLALMSVLAGGAAGAVALLVPGAPEPLRLLGAAAIGMSLSAAAARRDILLPWFDGDDPAPARRLSAASTAAPDGSDIIPLPAAPDPPAADPASDEAPHSETLAAASPGTASDLKTALQLLGSAISEEVDTSVQTVLDENQKMVEMASDMAIASAQARGKFEMSIAHADAAEGGITQLNTCSGELTQSIERIASEIKRSIAVVRDTSAQAATTRTCVETMATLSGAVSEVTRLIDGVAKQTRLLALNATIEAARAGELGKGFAVVASEVKELAHQTADATQVIGQKIAEMNAMVKESVASLQRLVESIGGVDATSASIEQAIAEQHSLAERVASSLANMHVSVFTLSGEIREAAELAATSGRLSDLVLERSAVVDDVVGGLKGRLQYIGGGMGPLSAEGTSSDHAESAHE